MAKFFTPAQINEFKECFSFYDKKRNGKIDTKDLITVMRCLGTSPTYGEIERHLQVNKIMDDLFKEANVKPNGIINYEEFTRMVTLPPVDY
ncbi:calmodulin-like protein 4 [Nematolebias whitei]|uniref:calmodulin-like protein 4 n=1 Tax=Nematolebias whitei TaxID=451745 RepID=UPI0018985B2E|nr:calmodulin-like protein 4 [Nematolebias whitei]